jgi:hypothetical protein
MLAREGVDVKEWDKATKGKHLPERVMPKTKKRKVKDMHIRRAASGGYIAKHPNDQGSLMHEDPDLHHALPDMGALQAHMQDHMGDDEKAEPEAT